MDRAVYGHAVADVYGKPIFDEFFGVTEKETATFVLSRFGTGRPKIFFHLPLTAVVPCASIAFRLSSQA